MKLFLSGLIMVCIVAVVIFFGYKFYFHVPKSQTVAQNAPATKDTTTSKKTDSTPVSYKPDSLTAVEFVPYYDRKNDVQLTKGEVTCSALAGSLHEDPKKGALLVSCYSKSSFLGRSQYVTDQDHGALTVSVDGTEIRIVAEDGKEWRFGFEGDAHSLTYGVY